MLKPLILKRPKPRNPLTLPGRLRQAGVHRSTHRGDRQAAGRDLRRELTHWHSAPP